MAVLNVGDKAPDFTLPTNQGFDMTLSDFQGQKVVLYFYPKDNTPGCTKESCNFNDALSEFEDLNTQILGISKCGIKKHENFSEKFALSFPLFSDKRGNVCEQYDTWKEKSMYGKKYMGIERSTFLINEDGTIAHIWRRVKVPDHVKEVKDITNKL